MNLKQSLELKKYRNWDILDELPEGWKVDKTAGAPLPRTVFITNGKSLLSGQQKRALLRVEPKTTQYAPSPEVEQFIRELNAEENTKHQNFPIKEMNRLAREQCKERLLHEISFDLAVCEAESWDKREFIRELQELLNSFKV